MHIPKFVPFAIAQMNIDSEDKALVARWVETEIPLRSGAGIFLDAGSSCLAVWKEIVEAIRNNRYSNLTVYTSSLMVLQSWSEQQIVPQLLGTNLVLAGDEFDAPHLAFYGAAVTRKLLDGDFRPFSVYIGVSGIDFDDGIFLGYHAGDLEKQAKEALFRCPAKTRVILATPAKIGNAGGRVFNLLAMKGLDTRGSIYLVTTSPEPGTEEEKRFNKAREVFLGDGVQHALRAAGVQFSWIILDRNAKETPKALERLVGPRELTHDLK